MNRFLQTEAIEDATDEETAEQDETEFISRSILVMMLLVVVNSFSLSYRKKLSQRFPTVTKYLQDATITTVIGVLAGVILKLLSQGPTLVTIGQGYQNLFMIILLPPIIFESTLSMDKPSFFANFGSILVFAIFGTLIAMFITSLCIFGSSKMGFGNFTLGESFAFGSLISATDPVTVLSIFKELNADKVLWSLIYGESILNDAIGLTSYKVVVELSTPAYEDPMNPVLSFLLIFFGSVLLGFFIGMVCAWFFKKYMGISDPESQGNTEATVMMITPWVSYLIGEGFELSGIVTLMFCGIAINKYALPNMSESGKKMTHSIYSAAGTTFENLSFMFIGIGFFSFEHDWKNLGAMIFIISFIAITASRFIQIYLLSWIVNKFRDRRHITDSFKTIMANSGFRGAMAFAMATNAAYTYSSDGSGSRILTLTLVYACFTICVLGPFFMILIDRHDIREKPEDTAEEVGESGFGSHHCWNRVKRGFLAIDGHFEKFLIKDPKENPSESNVEFDDSATSRSMEKKAAFLQNQVVMENELARMDRMDSMTTIGPEGSESPTRKESR